jgi:hypothetical protein
LFPIFVRSGGDGRLPPTRRFYVALFVSILFYALLIAAAFHFTGIEIDNVMLAWYGLPALIGTIVIYLAAVIVTAKMFD